MAERIARREAIGMIGAAGAALAFGCQHSSPTTPTDTGTGTTTGGPTNAACVVTPSETVSPYPSLTHFVRSDIREGKPGTQLTLTIKVVNTNTSCGPITGANVEIRQCDAAGNYSQYGTQTTQTYLRGIQTTNANGEVTFVTVYPGWYQGRATHMHVEVVRDGASVKVTQIAFPGAVNVAVYGTGVYASRGSNPTSSTRDGIFADSLDPEMATVSGDPASGLTATFQVAIAA